MRELLIEIASEEIPARLQNSAREGLCLKLTNLLEEVGLPASHVDSFVTPRRIVLVANGIANQQLDLQIEKKGPATTAPQAAIDGFLRANNLNDIRQLEKRPAAKGEIYWAVFEKKGQGAEAILPALIQRLIHEYSWAKSMRFADQGFRWVRPITRLMVLFGGKKLEGSLDLLAESKDAFLPFCDQSQGHPILSPELFTVTSLAQLKAELNKRFVILDQNERKATIRKNLDQSIFPDEGLLEEVTGLVEWPFVLKGKIDDEYMKLPDAVLRASMRGHQKYFSIVNAEGKMQAFFQLVSNRQPEDGGKAIIAGNERVLRARLSDGKFFYEQDLKKGLESFLPALEKMVFHAKLGSLGERISRIKQLAEHIAKDMGISVALTNRAASLAKADLASSMVGEFPELQGIMGANYAAAKGEDPAVVDAIQRHYAPQGPSDLVPNQGITIALSLAEKLDTLVGFWLIDEKPTGSKDPYALRRAALGIIRLILENDQSKLQGLQQINLFSLIGKAKQIYQATLKLEFDDRNLLEFIHDRLRGYFKDQGFAYDHIEAVISTIQTANSSHEKIDVSLYQMQYKLQALQAFLEGEDAKQLLSLYKRTANILRAEQDKNPELSLHSDLKGLKLDAEIMLMNALISLPHRQDLNSGRFFLKQDFLIIFQNLLTYKDALTAFFDTVIVNDNDAEIRLNRLSLLKNIEESFQEIVDFSKLSGL